MVKSKIIQKTIAMLLVLTTLFTMIPQVAFASKKGESKGGKNGYVGDGDGDVGLSGGAYRANWNDVQQGVRISIVDPDMNNMLSGQKPYTAIDVLFSKPPSGSEGLVMTGNKFENYAASGTNTKKIGVGALNNLLNKAIQSSGGIHQQSLLPTYETNYPKKYQGMPRPILGSGSNTIGNGSQVKQFFIAGELGQFISSGGSGGHSSYKPVVSVPNL